MTGHVIEWKFDTEWVSADVVCQEDKGADCRLEGAGGCECESYKLQRDPDGTPFHTVVGWNDDASEEFEIRHEMKAVDYCQIVTYLEDCAEEANGDRETRVLATTPIEPVWDGDCYSWTFKEKP